MKKLIVVIISILLIVDLIVCYLVFFNKKDFVVDKTIEELNIVLKDDLTTEFLSEVKVSDFIVDNNYEIVDDYTIDTTKVGDKTITFNVKYNEEQEAKSSFDINVIDITKPLIWLGDTYTVYLGEEDFYKDIICVDNYDEDIKVEINGEYDINKIGEYKLTIKATDKSNNESEQDFTLIVKEYRNSDYTYQSEPVYFEDIVKNYKKNNTQIGLDLSSWQDDVDFEKLKESGVEFVILRVGSEDKNDERFLDSRFKEYITEANKLNIPVGVYFYSYADSIEKSREDAYWILEQIKDYKIDLPIAFDWENWSKFNNYHLSLYKLSQMAKAYLDVFKENGYDGMLYSSKLYLENFWMDINYPVWLAHYVDVSSYKGKYIFWQLTSSGRVPGIYGDVDIDIRYLD